MSAAKTCILAVNGGSSSIKFALFATEGSLRRVLVGGIERIGLSNPVFHAKGLAAADTFSHQVPAADHTEAVNVLLDWLENRSETNPLTAIGHRILQGGPKYYEPQRITADIVAELHRLSPFDPDHIPEEIQMIEALRSRYSDLPQIACFDTAFHHDLPRVAQLLPIPRRFEAEGVRRYGFHGLSYAFLMKELARVAGQKAAEGRVILAHLGNGASVAAVRDVRSIDTSMAFTPAAGLPMSTRSGDLDPGVLTFLATSEARDPASLQRLVNHESGLLGISETSSDVRDLLARERDDVRAAEAIEVFCYQTKKWIAAFAGALGGLDTVVFAGGIGENSAPIRARVCEGLQFIGLDLDEPRNREHAALISSAASRVAVRVIPTDEESVIARMTAETLARPNEGA